MLNSAAGVMFPPESDPPIMTRFLIIPASSGSAFNAVATFVSGPIVINVTSFGYLRTI